jgi:signal peptidase I
MKLKKSLLILLFLLQLVGCRQTKSFRIGSSSMYPTLKPGEQIVVDLDHYRANGFQRWDLIVFTPPSASDPSEVWCMRIVGLPGEKIEFADSGDILIDGVAVPRMEGQQKYGRPSKEGGVRTISLPYLVPLNAIFVLGDNVGSANDSRYWGSLDCALVIGKVIAQE